MEVELHCQSCGMSIENGDYCLHCTDGAGKLQSFEERFERMTDFMQRRAPGLSRAEAEERTRDYMRTMPAWKDHPALRT